MLQENTPYTHVVEFTSGLPTGVFSYSVYDEDGNIVDGLEDVVVSLGVGAISARIDIPRTANQVSKPLFETRTISWTYPTGTGTENGSVTYVIQRRVPFPVTHDGVRTMLGVTKEEIPDDRIDLLRAYIIFRDNFIDPTVIDPFAVAGDDSALKITKGIEALAAMEVLPTLQIAIARRFDTGTNSYERWNRIDWDRLQEKLQGHVTEAVLLIDPTIGVDIIPIFTLSIRTDPLTGV